MIEKLTGNGKGPITTTMIDQLHLAVFLRLASIGDPVERHSRQSGNFLVEETSVTNLILSNRTACNIFLKYRRHAGPLGVPVAEHELVVS